MTSSPSRPSSSSTVIGRPYRFSVWRVLLVSLCMALLVAFELYAYHTVFASFHEDLLEAEHKSAAWIEGQLAFSLPFITVCLFQYAVYRRHDREDGVFQKEKAWEIALLAVLIYGVLLPLVVRYSRQLHEAALAAEEVIPVLESGVEQTLFLDVLEWFVRLAIPLMVLLGYHAAKANGEVEADRIDALVAASDAPTTDEVPAVSSDEENTRAEGKEVVS